MLIRTYTNTDSPFVLQLLQLNTPVAFAPEELADFQHYLSTEKEDYFVVELNDQLVTCGGINYFQKEGHARISWDMVHPEHQGKGIGKELLHYRLERIEQQGIQAVQVRTSQFAEAFYARAGFKTKEITPDYWSVGYDLYDMWLQFES